ncbi:hypothetical protein HA402_009093 [Bradysia odoriphaga]|nr:hypothetical protein HA402_009093 [Bradysia odoriphaga]
MKHFFVVLLAFIAFQDISAGTLGSGIDSDSWANGITPNGPENVTDGNGFANGNDNIEEVPENVENEECDDVLGGVLCLVDDLVDSILGSN